ncbi:hypothetical protein [Brevundimonas sp.]|jgi:hypothetical protein|uniref:hypothetical protein n=1 Tax=Brevundimonas sp. TaxID=1871086 RepID=UPI0037BEFE78
MADETSTGGGEPNPLAEIKAMETTHEALKGLDPQARQRVFTWLLSVLGLQPIASPQKGPERTGMLDEKPRDQGAGQRSGPESGPQGGRDVGSAEYPTFADLFSAAGPTTNPEKALVGGYWLQVCEGADGFASMSVNNALKNLGEGVENITSAFDGLKDGKPQLALQVRKDGKSQQARKKYKLTVAGIRVVERMLRGERVDG